MTPAEQVAEQLAVTGDDVEPTTAQAVQDQVAVRVPERAADIEAMLRRAMAEGRAVPAWAFALLPLLDEARVELQAERVEHDRLLFAAAEAAGRTERVLAADVEDLTRALARVTAERDMALDQFQIVKQEMNRLATQVQRVRDLHRPGTTEIGLTPNATPRCVVCKTTAPCDTIAALDGGEQR